MAKKDHEMRSVTSIQAEALYEPVVYLMKRSLVRLGML